MRNYEERAKDFIKEIFPYIEDCTNPFDVRRVVRCYNAKNNRKVIVSSGMTRIALITSDYVIKYTYDEEEAETLGGCEDEVKMYHIAEQEGFAYLFAKITRYNYCDRAFYIMPRIRGVGRDSLSEAWDFMNQEEINFCAEYQITDLHCNNFGFRGKQVCLIDYACRDIYDSDNES